MYKISACVILCFCIPAILGLSDEMQELIDMLHKNCQEQTGADEALLQQVKKGDFSGADDKVKCFAKCIMAEMSTIDDDGTIDVDAAVAILPEDVKTKMEPIMRKCGTVAGANPCDNAFLTFKCYYDGSPADFFFP